MACPVNFRSSITILLFIPAILLLDTASVKVSNATEMHNVKAKVFKFSGSNDF